MFDVSENFGSDTPPEALDLSTTGLIIVDHGSRREASNLMLETFVETFHSAMHYDIVEPAHMELAEPSIATAFGRCVERGARTVPRGAGGGGL